MCRQESEAAVWVMETAVGKAQQTEATTTTAAGQLPEWAVQARAATAVRLLVLVWNHLEGNRLAVTTPRW